MQRWPLLLISVSSGGAVPKFMSIRFVPCIGMPVILAILKSDSFCFVLADVDVRGGQAAAARPRALKNFRMMGRRSTQVYGAYTLQRPRDRYESLYTLKVPYTTDLIYNFMFQVREIHANTE